MHFGRNAESMIAPETPRPFPLKSASVMEVSMVTPLKVNQNSARLLNNIGRGYWRGLSVGVISRGYHRLNLDRVKVHCTGF